MSETSRRSALGIFLDVIERVGNRLPDQASIFVLLGALTLLASWLAASFGWSVMHPIRQESVAAFNLLGRDGLQWVFASVVTNFTGFAPLGTVLVAMIGVGVAEKTGLFAALLKLTVTSVPRWLVPPTVIFAGINANIASDAGIVILPPLAALLYVAIGRHPLAGIADAFAGVSAGFSANLLLGTIDPLLAGITQDAARYFHPGYEVYASCNYYFMAASVGLLTLLGWFVSARIVQPRLGAWTGRADADGSDTSGLGQLAPGERRGLLAAGIALLATVVVGLLLVIPENGILRDARDQSLRPFFSALVGLIMLLFLVPGIAYGVVAGAIRSDRDVARLISESMAGMSGYIVLAFFAGQFIAWFGKSNLGFIIAIEGAAFLKAIHLTGLPLMLGFVVVSATINLLMSSASAKWLILAPVFVPMLMALGKSPELTQALFRVGDSCTNVITPLSPYLPILLAVCRRYVPSTGLGTLIAAMMPYSIVFLVGWSAFLAVWYALEIPLGAGAPLFYRIDETG